MRESEAFEMADISRLVAQIQRMLVAALMASFSVSVVQLVGRIFSTWDGRYLVVLALIFSLEALYTRGRLGHRAFPNAEWFYYRLSEWAVILLALRLTLYALRGFPQLLADMQSWPENFGATFFTAEFLLAVFLIFFIWQASTSFAEDLIELSSHPDHPEFENLGLILRDRDRARKRMVDRIFFFGGLMVILAALARSDLGVLWGDRPAVQSSGANVLAYFVLGLMLFSLSHLAMLYATWRWERIPVSSDMSRRWASYSMIFLATAAIFAAVLPTQYSLGILELLALVLKVIAAIIGLILTLFFFLLAPIIGLISALFPAAGFVGGIPQQPQLRPPVPQAAPPWLDLIRAIFFWGFLLAIAVYSVNYYLEQHGDLIVRLGQLRVFKWLADLIFWVYGALRGWNRAMRIMIQTGARRLGELRLSRSRIASLQLLNPLRMSHRRRIIFFYLSLVNRAGAQGLARKPSQTPHSYARMLRTALPHVSAEVEMLTRAFHAARYSGHPIGPAQAQEARLSWGQIRRALRQFSAERERNPGG